MMRLRTPPTPVRIDDFFSPHAKLQQLGVNGITTTFLTSWLPSDERDIAVARCPFFQATGNSLLMVTPWLILFVGAIPPGHGLR
jgi:hypothetical protein